MDVQTENTDPPPCETQSSGKIRKGFKLFGKRKPGNIFSIRNKGDGNNKSPVKTGKSLEGLSETATPDSEQDSEKEKGNEVSQGEREQAEEEPLGEDGVLAAAPARTSISSASSAKSLSFLSLLRGGRRGMGDRRAQTVSQPSGRQRRGLKGLFGTVRFRSKDKDDKEEAPPSPLLMSSRANSVEIIKEDLTLTPKSPRSLDSPVTEPIMSLTSQESTATSPSDTIIPQGTTGNVSSTNEHVLPLPDSEPPLIPGDNSLSSLLADISSLLTFESISGGDIMADVEAEWGKASSAISAVVTEVPPSSTSTFSKPSISSPLTSTSVRTADKAKPSSPVASTQSFTPLTKTSTTSSPIAKPSTIITTLTKSSTLTTPSVKLSSDSASVSTTPITLTSFSGPKMSSPSMTAKSSATTTAPSITPATVAKAPSVSSTLTSTISKPASEIPPPVSKPSPVAAPAPVKPPVTHSPPTLVSFTQPPPPKLDSTGSSSLQTLTSFKPIPSSVLAESKPPVTESLPSTISAKPASSSPGVTSKMTTVNTSTATSSSVSAALSKPQLTSSPMDLNKTTPSLATVPDFSSTFTSTTKTQPCPPPFPTLPSDRLPPAYKPPPAPASLDKTPPPSTQASASAPISSVPMPSPTPPGQIPVIQSKGPPTPSTITGLKDSPTPAPRQDPYSTAQIPVSQSKALTQDKIPVSKDPSPPCFPVSVVKDPPVTPCLPVSLSKDTPAPAPSPPAPSHAPVSLSKDAPASAQIQIFQSKVPSAPAPAPCPVSSSLSSPPSPRQSEASAKTRGSEEASVDGKLSSPSSTDTLRSQIVPDKTEEQQHESRASLQGIQREKKTPQAAKASGLSKIPVVGGGRPGKIPVRDSQHADDEVIRDPPTPVFEEERPNFNSHDAGSRDKVRDAEASVPTPKPSQEESQQQKALTSLPRDSKIPVKHGASQIPQAKETPRTKIPVSKVPVRRVGNKPAAAGGSTPIRK